ncbi:MAG: pilus assembly protein PilP [Pseudomonadota bacterium]|nr:pilus assembly protein PilP [Pseudomonadota bacterium]
MAIGVLIAGGCSPAHEDLRQWMAEERQKTQPQVTPISAPKQYVPLAYSEGSAVDPFSSERLTQVLRSESSSKGALVDPELARRKEPLEDIPLDAMTMVGSLARGGQRVALVRVNGLLHQVRVGNYLGQNYGRITRITENEVVLREIAQDAAGEWIERQAVLQLQENTE